LADSSAKQSRVERLGTFPRVSQFDGDKSPAQSGENSPYSKSLWLRLRRGGIYDLRFTI
jgi:hypothetical protein